MNDNKIRVVVTDPETRNAVTTSFDTMGEVITWAIKQLQEENDDNDASTV